MSQCPECKNLQARIIELEQQLERNRAILAGARNCILKYVPSSIESDRDFTLSTLKVALERKGPKHEQGKENV
jgi:hypothetical protein